MQTPFSNAGSIEHCPTVQQTLPPPVSLLPQPPTRPTRSRFTQSFTNCPPTRQSTQITQTNTTAITRTVDMNLFVTSDHSALPPCPSINYTYSFRRGTETSHRTIGYGDRATDQSRIARFPYRPLESVAGFGLSLAVCAKGCEIVGLGLGGGTKIPPCLLGVTHITPW